MNLLSNLHAGAFATALLFSAFTPSTETGPQNHQLRTASSSAQAVSKWTIDKAHSNVKFTVTHMVVSETEGNFKLFNGSMESAKPDFSDAKIEFSVDVNSINTENENRDKHLKGDDFFNAEKYPQMKFVSTSFTPQGDKKYKLSGNLTIRDVTKPVVFDVVYGGSVNDRGGVKAGFKATTTVNRFDYNLKWDKMTEAGGLVVSKDVNITVNVEMTKKS
ncbi:MAG: YceI family protein [Williamsia sp.]|nr:YceI family protein [Williamsia sp.]